MRKLCDYDVFAYAGEERVSVRAAHGAGMGIGASPSGGRVLLLKRTLGRNNQRLRPLDPKSGANDGMAVETG